MDAELWIKIDGEKLEVNNVFEGGYLPEVETESGDFIVAENSESAGEKAREVWKDMAENDKREFVCMVGEENLVSWALGEFAGPGSTQVRSLDEWLDLWLDTPEEEWASYDGAEREVNECSESLADQLGFVPTVAYRHN